MDGETLHATVLAYIEAWATPDDALRRRLLDRCWDADGIYLDPTVELQGREALSAHIGRFLSVGPAGAGSGHRIPIASGVDHHHGMIRFTWTLLDPDGAPMLRGMDVGELTADGRIRRIVGFFGEPAPVPDNWPEDLAWRGD